MTENEIKRPSWITFAAILLFLKAGFNVVFAISTFSDAAWLSEFKIDIGGSLWLSGIVDLVLAATLIVAGISLLRGQKFGIYFGFVFAGVNIIKWFFLMFWFPMMAIVSISIDILIIYALVKGYDYFDEYARLGLTG